MLCPKCDSYNCYETKRGEIKCLSCGETSEKKKDNFLSKMFKKFIK